MYNILFLTTRFPYPPDDGGKIDTLTNLKILAKNFSLFLFYIGTQDEKETKLKKEVKIQGIYNYSKDTKNNILGIIKNIFSPKPYTISKYHSQEIYKKIKKIIKNKNINIVFVDHLHMAYYGKMIKQDFPKIKVVLREHNVEYIFWKRILKEERDIFKKIFFWIQYRKVLNYEKKFFRIFDEYLMISPVDEKNIKKISPQVRTKILPPAVDTKKFNLSNGIRVIPHSIVVLGNFAWLPNLNGVFWFFKNVWSIIKRDFPNTKLFIVGKNPPEELKKYQDEDVSVTGYVDDVRPWIAKVEVFIAPLFSGSGIRIKILEAMAMGKSIISTSLGAEGIDIENMKNIIIADNKEEFVKGVELLFTDKKIQENLSKNARTLVERKYSFEVIEKTLKQIIENLFLKRFY